MTVQQTIYPIQKAEETPTPRIFTNVMLAAILFGSCYLDYWSYSVEFHKHPLAYLDIVQGVASAPAQYRIGVVDPAEFIAVHSHLALRVILTLIDLVMGMAATFTLLHILRKSDHYRAATNVGKWLAEVTFLMLTLYYLAWLIWYQRPETLATAALLAFALYLLIPSETQGRAARQTIFAQPPVAQAMATQAAVIGGLLLFSVCQSLVRADVAFALDLGILAVCFVRKERWSILPRRVLALTAALSTLIVVAIQYTLMHRVFSNATYGDTAVVQIFHNLRDPLGYPPFLLFTLPFFWTLWCVLVRRVQISGPTAVSLAGASLFLCMWSVVGITQEVRIFLPFALLLLPLTVTLILNRVTTPKQI